MAPEEKKVPAIEVVLEHLENEGVDHLFGIPGGALTPLYAALGRRGRMRHVLAKHEGAAAYMAYGYARVRHGLGVCCGTSGPGTTNALTGIATAHVDSVPVMMLSAQVSTLGWSRGANQESSVFGVDTIELMKPVTRLSAAIPASAKAGELTRHMIRAATSGRQRPVHLSFGGDVASGMVTPDVVPPDKYRTRSCPIDQGAVDRACAALASCRRVAILAGSGVGLAQANDALRTLAERFRIPVATTPKAKGALPESHPLSLGVFGYAGHARAERYLLDPELEALIVVGSSLGELATNAWDPRLQPSKLLVQIDLDPDMIGRNYPVDVAIVGDARAALERLAAGLPAGCRFSGEGLRATPFRERCADADLMDSDAVPLHPARVVKSVRAATPDDVMVFVDTGLSMAWFGHYFEARAPESFFMPMGLAAMGAGIGMGIGGKLAAPQRTAVVVTGDGAFAMHGMEVHTAVELGLPVIFLVMNDAGYGMVELGEKLLLDRPVSPSRFEHPIDARAIAAGLGVEAYTATTPAELEDALARCVRAAGPTLVDVRTDPRAVPGALRTRAETLRQYFAGQAK